MFLGSALLTISLVVAANAAPCEKRGSSLSWGPCTYNYSTTATVECATLEVPLDYTRANSSSLDLQLMRVRATQQPSKGSVLFNPGGPGSDGTSMLASSWEGFQRLFGSQFDVVAFDPRGTGRTIPFACNYTPIATSKSARGVKIPEYDFKNLLAENWEDIQHFADVCYEDNKETGAYLSTTFVVRDMVRIIDALGEDGLLRYYGMSYGTTIGQTFAAMFPEKVDRMVLDAVTSSYDFRDGHWADSMLDAEKAFDGFLAECLRAPTLCSISNITGNATTVESLKSAYADLLDELLESGQTIQGGTAGVPAFNWRVNQGPISLYEYVKVATVNDLYNAASFPSLANMLSLALARNFTAIEQSLAAASAMAATSTYNRGTHSFYGVECLDSRLRAAASPEEVLAAAAAQQASSALADGFVPNLWACAAWRFEPPERFEGRYEGRTRHPILFINGEYDPVTPLSVARNASTWYEGSVLLTHTGHGHTISGQVSNCTMNAMAEYFADGTLPPAGTVCEPNAPAFVTASG